MVPKCVGYQVPTSARPAADPVGRGVPFAEHFMDMLQERRPRSANLTSQALYHKLRVFIDRRLDHRYSGFEEAAGGTAN
jgi:hypothetical protein